jgi:RNA polymerase sigma-70 factor (ECF subfamily)
MNARSDAELGDAGSADSLLARIAGGDRRAFEAFYDTFHGRVYAFALKHIRNPADAAEILNEVMLEVWRNAARFEGKSRALTWVLGIAHHKAVDRLRRHARHRAEELDDELPEDDRVSALDALAGAEDTQRVRECLERLSDAQRLVVHLAFFEDLPYPEIAEIAACPVGTVKTRMFHARQLLKRCLGAKDTT